MYERRPDGHYKFSCRAGEPAKGSRVEAPVKYLLTSQNIFSCTSWAATYCWCGVQGSLQTYNAEVAAK